MNRAIAAAIYARISSDQAGEGLGVQRQLEDCRKIAADRGWSVAEEYVDNDISAYAGKRRPSYERMVNDIAEGRIDAVLVYHLDRLTRRPIELEHFAEVCSAAGVDVATVTGDVGLGNDNGLLIARITGAVAAAESDRKSERIKRKIQQNVQMGKPNGGAQRPFGFEPDKVTIRESEAAIIRQVAARYIAGESLISLARWMNAEGVPTSGKAEEWTVQALRPILMGGRIAGIRDHHGQPAGPAAWPAIITQEQHEQLVATFNSKNRTGRRPPRRYVLSGLVRCSTCGKTMISSSKREVRRYTCSSAPGRSGCGKRSINAQPVEEWVTAAVLLRLDTPDMADLLAGRAAADERHAKLVEEVTNAQNTMRELAEMFGAGEISRAELTAARAAADKRRADAQRQLDQITGTHALDGLVGNGAALAQSWDQLSLDRQHAIVRAVLDHVSILPSRPGPRAFDPSRVVPTWVS